MKKRRVVMALLLAGVLAATPAASAVSGIAALEVVKAEEDAVVYESDASVTLGVDFSELTAEDWGNKGEIVYAYTNNETYTLSKSYSLKATITVSNEALDAMGDSDYIKLVGITKVSDSWTYTKGEQFPYLSKYDFTDNGDGTSSTEITDTFSIDASDNLMEIDFEAVGVGFAGDITFSNVSILGSADSSDDSGSSELVETDPAVLCDFSDESDLLYWSEENGYAYNNGEDGNSSAVTAFEYNAEDKNLLVHLDYSKNSGDGWSEAKMKYTAEESVDISNYNQFGMDLILPEDVSNSVGKLKIYAETDEDNGKSAVINKDTSIDLTEAESLGNGYVKVIVSFDITPSEKPLKYVTVGLVGVNTSFTGDIYVDNLILSQKDTSGDYVTITSEVGEAAVVDLSNAVTTVNATDNLDDSATALLAYLNTVSNNDQVIFGHQYDINRSVSTTAEEGDTKEITGSASGVFGMDTLGLIGSEMGGTTQEEAFENAVAISRQAAANGSIITLSSHTPNFSGSKIVQNEDGTYDFHECDFAESKEVTSDAVTSILPGGEYNEAFLAYLDIIADYANTLAEDGIPVIFRPFHENTGSWFWWGSTNAASTYQALYRYTRDYLESKGVSNMLYVFSPGGPISSEEEYLETYPGDAYVDILAFDYYDDYAYGDVSDGSFYDGLSLTCEVISAIAKSHGKVAAISETGVRVTKKDGSDSEGLLVTNNPIGTDNSGTNWYREVSDIAKANDMPYVLLWANFSDTNFYVPYKVGETNGQELINDFIDYYNDDSTVFADGTNFYENISSLAEVTSVVNAETCGYITSHFDSDVILEACELAGYVRNGSDVSFVITNPDTDESVTVSAVSALRRAKAAANTAVQYTAELTDEVLESIGETETGTIALVVDGEKVFTIENIALGTDRTVAPSNVIEDFDYYSGSQSALTGTYSSNGAAGCTSTLTLDSENTANGTYGGAYTYTLTGKNGYTGKIKQTDLDLSEYNALQLWIDPDGMGQNLIIQIADASGEEFEVSLAEFVQGDDAQFVTIPFSVFKGKQNGTLDTSTISKFAIYVNALPSGETVEITSTIYFDAIRAVNVSDDELALADESGIIYTDEAIGTPALTEDAADTTGSNTATSDTSKSDTDKTSETTTSPKTSDVDLGGYAAVLAIAAAVLAIIAGKKKEEQ